METISKISSYKKDYSYKKQSSKDKDLHSILKSYRHYKYNLRLRRMNWQEVKGISKNKKEFLEIFISDKYRIEIRTIFKTAYQRIYNSLDILSLKDDWDEQGSKSYFVETFYQATNFIITYLTWVWDEFHVVPAAPEILPGPNGSIDLLWQNENYDLLINCKEAPSDISTFYGDDNKNTKIEGQFEMSNPNLGVLLCLLVNK